jgi:uncharacterized damage-inducible protein DinB
MITSEYCSTMAAYNHWMNERLYTLCAGLTDEQRKEDRGAFFKSVHSTPNHILVIELALLARFRGSPIHIEFGVDTYEDFDELRTAREELDQRITEWAAGLTPELLSERHTFVSKVDGVSRTMPAWVLAAQLFNHGTHHRGQVTTLLAQMGLDIGITDLPFMPGLP